MDVQRVEQRLRSEGFEEVTIRGLLKVLPELAPELLDAVQIWAEEGQVPDVEVRGISVHEVMRNHHNHFLVAIDELQTLMKSSLSAEQRESWERYLRTPLSFE